MYSNKYRNAGPTIQFPALIVIENQVSIDLLFQISTKHLFLEFTQWFSVSLWVLPPCKTSAIITSRTILSRKITFTRINSRSHRRSCCEYWRFSLFWRDPQTASEFQIKVGILEVCLCCKLTQSPHSSWDNISKSLWTNSYITIVDSSLAKDHDQNTLKGETTKRI